MPVRVLIFDLLLLFTLMMLSLTARHYYRYFRLLKPAFPVKEISHRIWITVKVALGQSKILQRPGVGLLHALLFWGFLIILLGTLEMVVDGVTGAEKSFAGWGKVYDSLTAVTDLLSPLISMIVIIFLMRRNLFRVRRFEGPEMTKKSHRDATITLLLILLLMITLTGMNLFYRAGGGITGSYPFSERLLALLPLPAGREEIVTGYHVCWWIHILTIFLFANYLPYSKHFHVYLSLPNVFLSRPWPMGKVPDMPEVTGEVQAMVAGTEPPAEEAPPRFGILDVEDVTRKNYLEALTCTQCGRCTDVCPVNLTGGFLSPRKVMMMVRERMDVKGPQLVRGEIAEDGVTLAGSLITGGELWACTMCNACVRECPLTINQAELILGMRRYKVLEEGGAPPEWNAVYTNVENNGALWKMPAADRMRWAEELKIVRDGREKKVTVPVMAEVAAAGERPEYLLWTGSAGAFDSRYRKVMRDFVRILAYLEVDFAVLGEEETSSGDFARRTGNEMLFVMQAMQNIEVFNTYGVTKILTCDPHAYNTFKNEYPSFGAMPEVIHHTQFLEEMMRERRLLLPQKEKESTTVTYHDPCYLGRVNGEYAAPRRVLQALGFTVKEMPRNRAAALCCGGGGGQMFREKEGAGGEIFVERTREALATGATTVVTACPYCMTMLSDGLKYEHAEEQLDNKDLAELVAEVLQITPETFTP